MQRIGQTIWITGLSGSGKTTLARHVASGLTRGGIPVVLLDGDELRLALSQEASIDKHSRESRLCMAKKYANLCNLIASQGFTVVMSTISLFQEIHAWNRQNLSNYFEIYLKVPLVELQRRDSKQIYSKFEAGDIHDVVGLDLPMDEPQNPHWLVEFNKSISVEKIADDITVHIKGRDLS